jgi:hypothetical protein
MILFTVLILVLLATRIATCYGWSSLVHPGLWFSISWIAAIFAYAAIDAVGGVPIYNDPVLDQLMILIIVTSLVFYILTIKFFGATGRKASVEFDHVVREKYRIFSVIGFLGAVVNWIGVGANFGYVDDVRQQWLEEIPRITALMWYMYFLTFPAAFMAGKFIGVNFVTGDRQNKIYYFFMGLPLLSGFMWSLGTGGRQALGLVLLHFIVGAAFGVVYMVGFGWKISRQRVKLLIKYTGLMVIIFSLFVGLTGLSRAKQQGAAASSFDDIWYLAPVGQLISYTGLTIATHQAYGEPVRRDIRETGPVSLAGLQYFGLRYITGWRHITAEDTNPERMLASSGLDLASGTRNLFYDLQSDFGFYGAMVVSGVLAAISSKLYFLFRIPLSRNILPTSTLLMSVMFWGYSNQFSLLMHNAFFWTALSFLLWDLSGILFKSEK